MRWNVAAAIVDLVGHELTSQYLAAATSRFVDRNLSVRCFSPLANEDYTDDDGDDFTIISKKY